jgi:hypothetical protein
MPSFGWCKTERIFSQKNEINSSNFYRFIAKSIFDVQSALNSDSHVPRNSNISFVIVRILFELINAKHNSIARLKIQIN